MIGRRITETLQRRLADYPAVGLVGPRQSGKTTLARSFSGHYFDLEQEPERLRLDLEWDRLSEGDELVMLDEVHAWPEVFPRLRGAIDARRERKGRFLLLGSVSPSLMVQVAESLAGRMSLVELTPFLVNELPEVPLRQLWLTGGYPEVGALEPHRYPQWQHDYLQLLIHRDLPNWGLPAHPQDTVRLSRMLAAMHGQTLNASQLGQSLGLSYKTIASYIDYLEGAFLVRRLSPYSANVKKRLVKRPKVYWRDSGLLHALLHVEDESDLLAKPWVGASWEGFVIEQILGVMQQYDLRAEPYYLRTSDNYEIDLLLDMGKRIWAIEIKLTSSPGPDDLAHLNRTADLVNADRRFLVSHTGRNIVEGSVGSCNLIWLLENLGDL